MLPGCENGMKLNGLNWGALLPWGLLNTGMEDDVVPVEVIFDSSFITSSFFVNDKYIHDNNVCGRITLSYSSTDFPPLSNLSTPLKDGSKRVDKDLLLA
jgi:hypothetical protein